MKSAFPFSRRQMLRSTACGFGGLALADMVRAASNPSTARIPGFIPKVKRVIFLFMAGGPSQQDLFDPKSFIREKHGHPIDSPLRKEVTQVGTVKFLALGAMSPVRPRGESGMMISDLMPHLSSIADDIQRQRPDLTRQFNQRLLDEIHGDAKMEGMIQNMELAFRMQTTTPQLVDLSSESQATLDLYGVGSGKPSNKHGRACLLARKLSESGVRFVQVTMDGWDHHGNIRGNLPRLCQQTDQPVAGLIKDLKQRGLLEDTLVLWSGEFGRTPWSQDLSGTAPVDTHGREHQPESFCAWMAGGGIKGGFARGETDHMGYSVVDGKVHIHDLHATMLHLFGIDHTQLTWNHLGRDFRLTYVHGSVVKEILA